MSEPLLFPNAASFSALISGLLSKIGQNFRNSSGQNFRNRQLAIISAVIRVLRSARAYSEERERYQSKWIRVLALQSVFEASRSADDRLRYMHEMENLAVEELREFLRTMSHASCLL